MNSVSKCVSTGVAALNAILLVDSQFVRGRKGDPTVAVQVLRDALLGEDWPPNVRGLADGAVSLFRWLRGVAQTEVARQAVDAAETAFDDLARWEPRLDLKITEQDLKSTCDDESAVIPECLHGKARFIANVELEERALDIALELIAEPPPAAPRPRPELFKTLWQGQTVREVSRDEVEKGHIVVNAASDDDSFRLANDAVQSVVPDDDAPALVANTYEWRALIVSNRSVRKHWLDLVESGFASDVLVFAPDAAWLICYFHHDYIDIVRRVGKWRHHISLPPILPDAR